jgi:hypothetical protein
MKTDDLSEQVRELCDLIRDEEAEEMKYIKFGPKGPNIFLCLQVPGRTAYDIGFLTLERETEDLYLVVFWTTPTRYIDLEAEPFETGRPRKIKVHKVEDHRPSKILTHYAKWYKFYKGE